MAGLGIPVAPILATTAVPLSDPTLDPDILLDVTAGREDFLIGFEPAYTRYFYLLSSSARSLQRCLDFDPRFRPPRRFFPSGARVTDEPVVLRGLHSKPATDRLPSILQADNPGGEATTVFMGGWTEHGEAPDPGLPTCQPMPMRILEYIMRRGLLALSFMHLTEEA